MSADKRDEMRKKLKLDAMGENQQKEMFQKFVQAGGQVVDLQERKKKAASLKKVGEIQSRAEGPLPDQKSRGPVKEKKRLNIDLSPEAKKDNPINQWIERFSSKLGCVLQGQIQWNGDLKIKFIDLILNDYQNALLNSRMVLASLLYQDRMVASEIKKRFLMDTVFPYYFELIFRFDNLLEEELFTDLNALRQGRLGEREIHVMMKRLFKPLFILQPYYYSLKTGLEKAVGIERELRKMDLVLASSNTKKLVAQADFIFGRFYSRIFHLVDYFYKCDTLGKPISFTDYLGVSDEDGVGFLTITWKEELLSSIRKESDASAQSSPVSGFSKQDMPAESGQEGASEDSGPDPVKRGIQMISRHIDFNKILEFYCEKKDPRSLFSIKDKVFLSYTLVDFFDKELAFVCNSAKVGYNAVFMDGKRIDMKRELSDLYYRITPIFERVNEYLKIIREVRKLENDVYVSIQERTARSNQYSLQRSQVSKAMRKEAREFFENFSKDLSPILTEASGEKKILQNPEALVEFDQKLNGDRLEQGKKVIDAIRDAYDFTSAAAFLLMDGDLGGFSILLERPIYLNIGSGEAETPGGNS